MAHISLTYCFPAPRTMPFAEVCSPPSEGNRGLEAEGRAESSPIHSYSEGNTSNVKVVGSKL